MLKDALTGFLEQLRDAAEAGAPLAPEIRRMARTARRPAWRAGLGRVVAALDAGRPPAAALEEAGDLVPDSVRALVAGATTPEALARGLELLLNEARATRALRRRLRLALFEPAMALVVAAMALVFVVHGLLPGVSEWVSVWGGPAPGGLIGAAMSILEGLGAWPMTVLVATPALAALLLIWTPGGRRLLAKLPVIGAPVRLASALRTLGSLELAVMSGAAPGPLVGVEGGPLGPALRVRLPGLVGLVFESVERAEGLPAALRVARETAEDELAVQTERVVLLAHVSLCILVGAMVLLAGLIVVAAWQATLSVVG